METGYQLTRQDLVYIALIGAGVGLLLGLIPLIIAIRKGKTRLGILGAVISAALGAGSPLLSLVVVAIFLWLILRKGSAPASTDAAAPSDTSQPE